MLLAMVLLGFRAVADTIPITMLCDDPIRMNVVPGNLYKIYDNGGPNGTYSYNCNAVLVLTAPEGYVMHFTGNYDFYYRPDDPNPNSGIDALKLFDSTSCRMLFGVYVRYGFLDAMSSSNCVVVQFVSDRYQSFCTGYDLTMTLVPVDPGNYEIDGCFNYTALNSPDVVCATGLYTDPAQTEGYVFNRHTIMVDTTAFDPFAVDSIHPLKVVPPGYAASVRLGNSGSGAQAERITYAYHVDTSLHDMLIMRYAAVLEDPHHTPAEQPKLTYRFLDEDGNELNSNCYTANFTASASLGWYPFSTGWYCDWTPVSVDLAPLHGQTIYIELTTYDCAELGHFGYAYFVFSCTDKIITSTSCGGNVSNDFTAPEGYSYTWRQEGDSRVISTDRTLHVTEAGKYYCSLHPPGAHGSSCDLVMEVEAGERYPYAQFEYQYTNPGQFCDGHVHFNNRSVVTRDPTHTQVIGERCERFLWDFGDGTTSNQMNPSHYFAPGHIYNVKLKAMLANGDCADSTVQQVEVVARTHDEIFVDVCEGDSYRLYDTLLSSAGVYTRDTLCHTRKLHLNLVATFNSWASDTVVENALPYTYEGCSFNGPVQDTAITLTSVGGCDSIIHFSLYVHPNEHVDIDMDVCDNMLPFEWNGIWINSSGTFVDTLHNQFGADSIVVMTVTSYPNYDTAVEITIDEGQHYKFGGHDYDQPGVYQLLMRSINNCDSLVEMTLVFNYKHFYAPNVFTPDLQHNNRFGIQGENILDGHVWVYERRGLIVADFDLKEGEWDGTKEGSKMPQGTYVWICKYRNKAHPDESLVARGTVTLVR